MVTWYPGMTISDVEIKIVETAYKFFGENKTKTAKALGIAIRTLDSKLEKCNNAIDEVIELPKPTITKDVVSNLEETTYEQ